jgi:hypothetical protein
MGPVYPLSISELKINNNKHFFLFLKETKSPYDWRQLFHRKKETHKKDKDRPTIHMRAMPTSSYPILF